MNLRGRAKRLFIGLIQGMRKGDSKSNDSPTQEEDVPGDGNKANRKEEPTTIMSGVMSGMIDPSRLA